MADAAEGPLKVDAKTEMKKSNDHIWKSPMWTERIEYLLNNEHMSDITFLVNGEKFHAHKFVLALDSEIFYAMFYGPMADDRKEIDIVDCENPEDFLEFLSLIYKKSANVTWENVEQLSYLRKKYMVMEMGLFSKLVKSTVKTNNCLRSLDTSVALEEDGMIEECLGVIRRDVSVLVKAQQFLELKQPALKILLTQDILNIREIDLFNAVDKWCSYQVEVNKLNASTTTKRDVLGDALYQIRFPLMELEDFATYCRPSRILKNKEIVDLYDTIVLTSDKLKSMKIRKSYDDEDGDESNAAGADLGTNFPSKVRIKGNLYVCINESDVVNCQKHKSARTVSASNRAILAIGGSKNVWLKGLKNVNSLASSIKLDGRKCELEFVDEKIERLDKPYFMMAGKKYEFQGIQDYFKFTLETVDDHSHDDVTWDDENCLWWTHRWGDFECTLRIPNDGTPLPFTQMIFSIFDAVPMDMFFDNVETTFLDYTAKQVRSHMNKLLYDKYMDTARKKSSKKS